ncbi:hypothetical protein [Amycolatopsis saalfeldensis]|nr:hypothetical protein [Amycolatopsis saalfeldensis]
MAESHPIAHPAKTITKVCSFGGETVATTTRITAHTTAQAML